MGQALRRLSCGSAEPLEDPKRPPPSPPRAPSPPPFPIDILSYPHIFTSVISYCSPPTLSVLLRCSKSTFEAVIPILYRELHFTQFRFARFLEVKRPDWKWGDDSETRGRLTHSEYIRRAWAQIRFLHLYEYKSDSLPINPSDFPSLSIIHINYASAQSHFSPAPGLFKRDSHFVGPICVSIRTTELGMPTPQHPLLLLSSEVESLVVDYCLHRHYAHRDVGPGLDRIPIIDSVIAIYLPSDGEDQTRSGTLAFGYDAELTMLGEETLMRESLRLVGLDILGISGESVRERHFSSLHPHLIFSRQSILDHAVITSDTLPAWIDGRVRKVSATIRAEDEDSDSEEEPSVILLHAWEPPQDSL